ncbi:flagellar protein export ATPase FliI [Sphingomonas sp. Leaf231]|uniref:flagellar protein export ATPase FliI n=1 Tax=Sphingomonas sp. Leaf231 TaxID=1736301 RepID=UPI000700523B|nr:flagellar protein export ATPase FliI [Sphingomonas sp. Leaf231]KQN90177.1 flagellar protein export ATPase FliI [Sphingomonas sp. Leaf231]
MMSLTGVADALRAYPVGLRYGRVVSIQGALVAVEGLAGAARIGSRVTIGDADDAIDAEVIGLDRGIAQCLPFNEPRGLASGARAVLAAGQLTLRPSPAWLGRVLDGLGRPIDDRGPLLLGPTPLPIRAAPPPAARRARVGGRLETGIAAVDMFAPLCLGQRLGLFAGSGIGKSTMLAMLAKWTDCDVAVIGLIGERGREVTEFIEDDLGAAGLSRSVVVVATSDETALMRRQAAWTTLAIAEHFRDRNMRVLCLMDSVTRFATAQREIGLASGEPPATRGYTPTVFAELPRLLERAGPGERGSGSITGVFTVLVDGDDHNEPIADAVRGTLDGHVVLSRRIAERGRYPAVDVLASLSRMLPHAHAPEEEMLRLAARRELSIYRDMEEMIRLGAYKAGANPAIDRAVAVTPEIEVLLSQGKNDRRITAEAFARLDAILNTADKDKSDADTNAV